MEKQERKQRFPTFPQPRRLRTITYLWDTDSEGKVNPSKPHSHPLQEATMFLDPWLLPTSMGTASSTWLSWVRISLRLESASFLEMATGRLTVSELILPLTSSSMSLQREISTGMAFPTWLQRISSLQVARLFFSARETALLVWQHPLRWTLLSVP